MPISVIDIIPASQSSESEQNGEPSLGINPQNPQQIVAGVFGGTFAPYFISTNGGTTWSSFGTLKHGDTTEAFTQDGSRVLAAILPPEADGEEQDPDQGTQINTYSTTVATGFFANPIQTFPGPGLDQPWLVTGPNNHVYYTFNDTGAPGGRSAQINVSTDNGQSYTNYTLDRVGGSAGQDDPAVRDAVNGNVVYAVFDRWTSVEQEDDSGTRYNSQIVVMKSANGGADGFTALGVAGNGVQVDTPISVFANTTNTNLTVGQQRSGSGTALAVDPNDANHVLVAYVDAPGPDDAGVVQLVVSESFDGGQTWSQKFASSYTGRSGQPGLAILTDGTIGLLYNSYIPGGDNPNANGELVQTFVTTTNDFVTTNSFTLGTETNTTPDATGSPYLGDYFYLASVGTTFDGIFSASNKADGSDAEITNVTFRRDFTGTVNTSSFQLTDADGKPVSASIDPYFFTLSGAGVTTEVVSSGVVSSGVEISSGTVLTVLSGGTANATDIDSGGTVQVNKGGTASGTLLSGGGVEAVYGSDSNTQVRGGTLRVVSGGAVTGATVSSGGVFEIWSSGTATSTTVLSGGALLFYAGEIDSATTFSAGATEIAGSGFEVSGRTISSGLTVSVASSGSAENDRVLSGGAVSVGFLGVASGNVLSGGSEIVSLVGKATGTVISSGGLESVLNAGVVSNTVVSSGGTETISSGGFSADALVISGGALIVSSGGTFQPLGSNTMRGVTVQSGGTVLIGSGYLLSNYIIGNGATASVQIGRDCERGRG